MAVLTLSCLFSENMKGAESQFQSSDSHHIAKCHHSASVLMLQLARVKYCINWQHFHFVSLYCKCNPVSYLSLSPQKQPWSLLHRLGESVSQNGKGFRGSRGPWPEWAGPISEVCFPSTTIISKGSFSHSLKPCNRHCPLSSASEHFMGMRGNQSTGIGRKLRRTVPCPAVPVGHTCMR